MAPFWPYSRGPDCTFLFLIRERRGQGVLFHSKSTEQCISTTFTSYYSAPHLQRARLSATMCDGYISKRPSNISPIMDTWSSWVYLGYIVINVHWIEQSWKLRSKMLDSRRFTTPHTGSGTVHLLFSVLQELDLEGEIQCVTTDNASHLHVLWNQKDSRTTVKQDTGIL